MKKLITLCLMLTLGIAAVSAQKINGMGVFLPNKQSFISTTTDLDSITYKIDPETKAIIQQIWEKDSLYEYPISTIDSTQFETFDLPDGIIIKEGIGDWSEMRLTKDGLCMLQKFYEDSEVPEKLVMFGKGENGDAFTASIFSEQDGTPKYIGIDDFCIIVDSIYNDSIDLTIAYKDSIAFIYNKIPLGTEALARGMVPMRSWKQMNEHAKRAAILQVTIGVIQALSIPETIIVGAAGTAAAFEGGIGAGLIAYISTVLVSEMTLISATNNIITGLSKIFAVDYKQEYGQNDISQSIAMEIIGQKHDKLMRELAEKHGYEFALENNMEIPKWATILITICEIGIEFYDKSYGRTYTWDVLKDIYQEGISTVGYDMLSRSKYKVRSFVSPLLVRHPVDNHLIDCEYGIIVYKDEKAVDIRSWCCNQAEDFNGRLEAILTDLEPETTYTYQAYFYDIENGIRVFGDTLSFTTASLAIPEIENFEVLDATYSEEGYPYGDETYSYKFDCAMTVKMEATEGMEDYGYIYKGVDGNESQISLKGKTFPYTDDNYVYYRKRSYSTATFCGYVKYYNDENIYKGKWQTYVLSYGKQPTPGKMIDLGLSVKWAAYNVGADYPEETGNLYAWGEIETKEEYIWQTYKYKYGGAVIYCDNLGDISGNPKYDAARSSWGYGWCIPHSNEVQELVTRCKKEDMTYEGVKGMLFTGPNGNSIFVPKMSYWLPLGISANYTGQTACTWYPFTSEFMATNGGSNKCVGLPIRAVYK